MSGIIDADIEIVCRTHGKVDWGMVWNDICSALKPGIFASDCKIDNRADGLVVVKGIACYGDRSSITYIGAEFARALNEQDVDVVEFHVVENSYQYVDNDYDDEELYDPADQGDDRYTDDGDDKWGDDDVQECGEIGCGHCHLCNTMYGPPDTESDNQTLFEKLIRTVSDIAALLEKATALLPQPVIELRTVCHEVCSGDCELCTDLWVAPDVNDWCFPPKTDKV